MDGGLGSADDRASGVRPDLAAPGVRDAPSAPSEAEFGDEQTLQGAVASRWMLVAAYEALLDGSQSHDSELARSNASNLFLLCASKRIQHSGDRLRAPLAAGFPRTAADCTSMLVCFRTMERGGSSMHL